MTTDPRGHIDPSEIAAPDGFAALFDRLNADQTLDAWLDAGTTQPDA